MRITARCPATTANLGPGFDCLGMALDLWNEVRVEVLDAGVATSLVTIEGHATGISLDPTRNLLVQTAQLAFALASGSPGPFPPCSFHLINRIPPGRGLGSSAAAVVLGLVVGSLLADPLHPMGLEDLFEQAARLEGHADNVAAAIFGSVQLCYRVVLPQGRHWAHRPIPPTHPNLAAAGARVCLFVPEQEALTRESRQVLDRLVPREVAVFNASHVGLLVAAILGGRPEDLAEAGRDLLHQPQRAALFPHLEPLLRGAPAAGAWMAWLSGAGSTVALLAPAGAKAGVEELCRAVQRGTVWIAGTVMWLDYCLSGVSWNVDLVRL